jgi:DHA2 family multidrug resistance protein-like MFS transporter
VDPAESSLTHARLTAAQRRLAVCTLIVGTVMGSMDGTIANVALPTIAGDLHASASASIWVVNAYQLATTISLLSFASLGDIFGYTRIYRLALVVFIIASLLCAMSRSLLALTLARLLQGFAASAQMAVAPAVARSLYPPAQLGRAVSNSALAVAISAVAGPAVAGLILSLGPWPWLFLINVPLGIVTIVLAYRYLPTQAGTRHPFDIQSAIESALTFGLFVVAIDGLGHGVNRLASAFEFGAMAIIAAAFLRRQFQLEVPLLPIDLFKVPMFSLSIATSYLSFVAQALTIVTLPFYFEDVLRFSAVATGLLMTPWPITVMFVAKPAGRLADRYPAGVLTTIGMGVVAAGLILIVLLPPHPSIADIAWRMAVCGLGTGFFQSPNNRAIQGSAPIRRSGAAGGVQAMARVTGQTTGAALVALIFGLFASGVHASRGAIIAALELATVFVVAAGLMSSLRLSTQVQGDGAPQKHHAEQKPQDAIG